MPTTSSLEDLMIVELSDLLDAERQLTKALPKLVKKTRAEELCAALEEHLEQTKQQVDRLTHAFEALDRPAGAQVRGYARDRGGGGRASPRRRPNRFWTPY